MDVIDPCKTKKLLECHVAHSYCRAAIKQTPPRTVTMHRELRMAAHFNHPEQTHRDQIEHDAHSAMFKDKIMLAAHGVQIARNVEGEHHLFACCISMSVDDLHHSFDTLGKKCIWWIGLQFVILDKIYPGLTQVFHQCSGILGRKSNTWFDNRPDQRAIHNP